MAGLKTLYGKPITIKMLRHLKNSKTNENEKSRY
jgi:hypothetical protein